MAVAGTNVSNFAGLNFTTFTSAPTATTGAAQTVAHGIAAFVPSVAFVIVTAGHNGAGGAGTQMVTITAVSVDAANINFTSDVAGATVTAICF